MLARVSIWRGESEMAFVRSRASAALAAGVILLGLLISSGATARGTSRATRIEVLDDCAAYTADPQKQIGELIVHDFYTSLINDLERFAYWVIYTPSYCDPGANCTSPRWSTCQIRIFFWKDPQ